MLVRPRAFESATLACMTGPTDTPCAGLQLRGFAVVIMFLAVTMTGCTQQSPRVIGDSSQAVASSSSVMTTRTPGTATTPVSSAQSSPLPPPSAGTAPVRRCSYGAVIKRVVGPDDAVAGPVVIFGANGLDSPARLSNFYGGGQVFDGPAGSKFYKMGISVQAGAAVIISVAPSALSYLRLQQGPGRHLHGETSFAFQACPGPPTSYTSWVGGFDIRGRMPVCVALKIQVVGDQTVRHLSIPFGGHTCSS